jgi:hypothetical protein
MRRKSSYFSSDLHEKYCYYFCSIRWFLQQCVNFRETVIMLSKQLERKIHILLLINTYTDKFSESSTMQVSIQDLIYIYCWILRKICSKAAWVAVLNPNATSTIPQNLFWYFDWLSKRKKYYLVCLFFWYWLE